MQVEPADHAIGRSRGGVTTKSHALVDGQGRAMVVLVGAGQAGDSPMLPVLLDELRVDRIGPGRPRTTPDPLRGDKAYSCRAHRAMLRSRGIKAVIPERADQVANRARKGRTGGRPVGFDPADYKNRNVIERFFNRIKHWRAIATRYDKHAVVYRGGIIMAAILDWLR
jgi:transposase